MCRHARCRGIQAGQADGLIHLSPVLKPVTVLATPSGRLRYDSANTLVDDKYFDNLSGQQAYKCFACRVKKA